jgi:2-polyprenyl-3-methyl-5-hydroxy-6-metoxy-1,4-benzoquinol methylase
MDAKTDNGKGSWVRYWVNRSYKIPVAGYLIRILTAILNLPQIVRNINEYQNVTDARLAEKADRKAVEPLHLSLAGKADRGAAEDAHSLDAMYMSFEDRFRGTRAEIEQKLRVYLPLIHPLGSKREDLSILDVGCGRGEWLELLREEGYRAGGIDINRAAVQQCRGRGLDVKESDVIDHLRGLDRGSLDVVTGFHIIEHLPFPTMAALFDEAFAVLKPGGMIILETPNPTNLLVSAYDFYRDPGHIRPLHPDTVNFIAETRGFVRTGSYFVSDAGPDGTLIKSTDWKLDDIHDYIRAPRDFALIGYKP